MRILVHLQPQFPETVEGEFFKFSEKPQHYIADTLFNTSTVSGSCNHAWCPSLPYGRRREARRKMITLGYRGFRYQYMEKSRLVEKLIEKGLTT